MKILYVLDIFPAVSETFIVNEIVELERHGAVINILSRRKEKGIPHGLYGALKGTATYLPDGHNLKPVSLFFAHIMIFLRHPINYIKTFFFALSRRNKGGLFWFFKIACYYARVAGKYRFSHIHSHFASVSSCYAMLMAMLLGKPFTFTVHGIYDLFIAPPEDMYDRAMKAKKVITISEYNKNYMVEKFKIPADKIEVVRCGVDVARFKPLEVTGHQSPVTGNESHLGGHGAPVTGHQPPVILSVARLDPVKGLDTLVKACRILSDKKIPFKCKIIGEGKERPNLENLIIQSNLIDKVVLLGSRKHEDLPRYYSNADIFVLPSNQETMGVTTMEAMASGLPVISSNIYGIPELIDDKVNGFLITPGNAEELAGYLEELIKDADKREEFGRRGREKVAEKFNLVTETRKLKKIIEL